MYKRMIDIYSMWAWPGGLITVWQQTRQEADIRLRRGGIWSPVYVTPGHGRAVTLALLCKVTNKNVVRAPNAIPHQRRGRRRGLSSLLHSHSTNPSLEPITVATIGMGRVRSRDSGPWPSSDPHLHVPNTWPKCLWPQRNIPNPPLGPNTPLPEAPSGLPSLDSSITSSESSKSDYEADSD